LPLGFAPLRHHLFQFLVVPFSQEAQQGLDFRGGHLGPCEGDWHDAVVGL
jgi:hypothetical protein